MGILQQFSEVTSNSCHAGSKAVSDVTNILRRLGFEEIKISRSMSESFVGSLFDRLKWVARCARWRSQVKDTAIVVVQYTVTCWHGRLAYSLVDETFKRKKGIRVVAIIHDLDRSDSARNSLTDHERRFFAMCDRIVVHNSCMQAFLVRQGVDSHKLIVLGIFDYLTTGEMRACDPLSRFRIAICGNLFGEKCGYLNGLGAIKGVQWELYGPNFDETLVSENVVYQGVCAPDELPSRLSQGFGLVWDGGTVDGCNGMFGEYLRINNPHKLSLYLASGIPVIIWREAAEARLVLEEGVGIAVDSLRDIPAAVRSLTEDSYQQMWQKTRVIGARLRSGYYMKSAMQGVLNG